VNFFLEAARNNQLLKESDFTVSCGDAEHLTPITDDDCIFKDQPSRKDAHDSYTIVELTAYKN